MNYKIRVQNKAESKEAQELLFALGGEVKLNDRFGMVCLTNGRIYADDIKFFDDYSDCKELTIPQLKDMVVLKRNDVADATHVGQYGDKWVCIDSIWYFYTGMKKWDSFAGSDFMSRYDLKPITKEPVMKEFLNPDQGYGLVHCAVGETPIPKDWIEVPEGSMFATGKDVIFRKDYGIFGGGDWKWTDVTLKNADRFGLDVIWQRETINDKVASAEVVRQDFIAPQFDDLPEFEFEVGDVVDAEFFPDNVNQPSHYCSHPSGVECIEITRHHDFAIGNAIKYLWRAGLKDSANEIQDLEKASWYIQDKINQLKKINDQKAK